MSWWKSLVAKLIEAAAAWGQGKLTEPQGPPSHPTSPPKKAARTARRKG